MGRPGLRDHSQRAAVDITRAAAVDITRAAAVDVTCDAAVDGGFWVVPATAGSGVPTTLPTQPSPTFVCVTGPGGSCLQPGAGLPVPQTWTPTVPGWLTSGVTGGCLVEVFELAGDELLALFEKMGDAIQFDESNGNFFVLLSGATGLDYCSQLATTCSPASGFRRTSNSTGARPRREAGPCCTA